MQSNLSIPPPPAAGTTIAVVSPSSPGVALWPHRVEAGVAHLERLGFVVRVMPHAAKRTGWTAGTSRERADDINEAFADPDVGAIIASIGGNHSAQLLPHLDYDLISSNAKVFQGYSDITTLHWALFKNAGLQTFYGPALIPEFGEFPRPFEYTQDWMLKAWSSAPLHFSASDEWTDEFLDWNERGDLERPRRLAKTSGWVCVRPGVAKGPLMGGCLETISWHVRGTDIWTDPDGAIFFLETSEEAPSPAHIDAYLTTLERQDVFERINGLVVGRAYGYDNERNQLLLEVLAERTSAAGIPVLADFDIGHTDPMVTFPFGAHARLDAGNRSLEIVR